MGTFYDNLPYTTDIIRLAQNENPYGPSPKAIAAIKEHLSELNQYPTYNPKELINKIASHHKLQPEMIAVSAGSVEMIDLVIKGFIESGDEIIIPRISFVAYSLLCEINRRKFKISEMDGFSISLDNILDIISPSTRLIFIANPNNPTGNILTEKQIINFLDNIPKDIIIVLDEAYLEYVKDPEYPKSLLFINKYPNLILFRTFSKIYGLAGLRIGYSISSEKIASKLQSLRTPFSVSKLSNVAALAALDDYEYIKSCSDKTSANRIYLEENLKKFGFHYIPSQTNFIFISFDSVEDRDRVNELLYNGGIIARKTDAFGCNEGLRITIGDSNATETVVRILSGAV